MQAVLRIWDRENCSQIYRRYQRFIPQGITGSLFCAGDPESGRDSCQGDSGGPIHADRPDNRRTSAKYVIGLTAFGGPCGAKTIPAVYTKVYPYLNWIEEIVWKDESF